MAEMLDKSTAYQLIRKEKNSLETELAVAEVEQVLERGPKKIQYHSVVVALGTVPPHERDADTTGESLVHLRLILELRMLGFNRLELDGDFLARYDVDTEVDVTYKHDVLV
jgi:hypothetical protein